MDKFDFSGWATKNDLVCTDGRTIRQDAFKADDRKTVPLVWQHLHNEPTNVLGHAVLENRVEGVYCYCVCNGTPAGQNAKLLVQHGDITTLSIYANGLIQKGKDVVHGVIRELSLVLAGANPGAVIDNLNIVHEDGSDDSIAEDAAIIYTALPLSLPEIKPEIKPEVKPEVKPESEIQHGDNMPPTNADEKTVGEVFDSLTEEQKTVVYALIAEAVDAAANGDNMAQSDEMGENGKMKKNVFDGETKENPKYTLSHADFMAIQADAIKSGSFRDAFLSHLDPVAGEDYGIENIDYMFPDAQTVGTAPALVQRRMKWVGTVINGTYHTPFSRIKSLAADLTAAAARAKGYVKGSQKTDEVISLLRRITTPTTIYKKQKLDRDDIVDITDFDVVVWMKAEMRVMLDEELARAILVGDGRAAEDPDKIAEDHIRPIWTDDEMYANHVTLEADADTEDIVTAIIRSYENYNGSGTPTMFVRTSLLTDMLLMKAMDGRRLYVTQAELEAALRVSSIVEVPVMSTLTRENDDEDDVNLLAIIVNLKDYAVGADKGGQVSLFDDFDIDYNQQKYLLETRCSGALVLPQSATVIEQIVTPEA